MMSDTQPDLVFVISPLFYCFFLHPKTGEEDGRNRCLETGTALEFGGGEQSMITLPIPHLVLENISCPEALCLVQCNPVLPLGVVRLLCLSLPRACAVLMDLT